MTPQRRGAALPDPGFWRGRRALVTGHTGFKGAWLTCWLRHLGAEVMGVSLAEPPSQPSLWDQMRLAGVLECRADVAGRCWVDATAEFDPQVVLHLAAQPLVSVGYDAPARTFESNVLGTVRVLEALDRWPSAAVAVIVTTDKVYDPSAAGPYRESHRLGGHDPYAASKAAVELVAASWPSRRAAIATARAGNVIGGGDWAADRLIPDLVRSWRAGRAVRLRNPAGVRPWQHVLEPLRGYLLYAQALAAPDAAPPRALNFGPANAQSVTVADVVAHAARVWVDLGGRLPSPASIGSSTRAFVETGELTLDSAAAVDALDWTSLLNWQTAVGLTLEWYVRERSADPAALVSEQLHRYTDLIGSTS